MKKLLAAGIGLALMFSVTQTQAASTIQGLIYNDVSDFGYFNCAYKLKIASKKCFVRTSKISSARDVRAKNIFGADESLPLLTIKWPDGDTSRYMDIGGDEVYKLINLADQKNYRYKTDNNDGYSLNFTKGLVILSEDSKEHIRLW